MKALLFMSFRTEISAKIALSAHWLAVPCVHGSEFDMAVVSRLESETIDGLSADAVALDWKKAANPDEQASKFGVLIAKIGGAALAREWTYPGKAEWPLVDWDRVDRLSELRVHQGGVANTPGAAASTDAECANLLVAGWLIRNEAKFMKPWFESWFLSLAKGTDQNTKRLALWSISMAGEDIGDDLGDSEARPVIRWALWEQAFRDADNLGKAVILSAVADLATFTNSFDTAKTIHELAFSGADDAVKAYALAFHGRELGEVVRAACEDLAANPTNPKLKALATELLAPAGP